MKNKKYIIPPLVQLLVGGVILTLGDLVAAQWIRFGGSYLYLFVLLFYFVAMMFLLNSYKSKNIPVASIILVIFNAVTLIFAGMFFFGEHLNPQKIIGILLCFVSIFLLEFGKRA